MTGGAGRTAAAGPRAGQRQRGAPRGESAARKRGATTRRFRETRPRGAVSGETRRWALRETKGQKIGAGWGGKIQQRVRHSTGKTRRGGGGGEAARRAEGDGRSWQSIAAAMRAANAALVAGSDGAMGEALDMARQCQGEVVFAIFGK